MTGRDFLQDCLPLRGRWLGYFTTGMTVCTLVGGLAYACWPRYHIYPKKGPRGAAITQVANFKTALELYRVDHDGRCPPTTVGLQRLINPPINVSDKHWLSPYLNDVTQVPRDPWDFRYQYQSPGPTGEAYLLTCYGSDGRPGGEGDAANITGVSTPSVVR